MTLILISSQILLGNNQGSDFLNIGPDAKTLGMGGAQVAVANNAYAAYWNPAGIQGKLEMTSTFATLFNVVKYNYFGFTCPSKFGRVAFSYISAGSEHPLPSKSAPLSNY
jgi:hypothetical protein